MWWKNQFSFFADAHAKNKSLHARPALYTGRKIVKYLRILSLFQPTGNLYAGNTCLK